jgi:outer membrane receptor protein involved in Fe transport
VKSTILFKLINILIAVLLSTTAFSAEINGVVKDPNKKPLTSITIKVKGTDAATLSDAEGKFKLTIPDNMEKVVLVFERPGCYPQESPVPVNDRVQLFRIFFVPVAHIREKISVTALDRETESISIPMAETSITLGEIQEKIPENIIDSLSDTTGVHFIGKGGFSVTPSIRGLARRRVLMLVDGFRVTSDRRVGSSASFVTPEMAHRVEVVRSAASVLYGSDAIGGVVNILTRPSTDTGEPGAQMNALNLNLNSINNRVNTGIALGFAPGKWQIYGGFQLARSGNYDSPGQKIAHSGYDYYSGVFDISRPDENRDFYLGYVGGYGKDIGKPDRVNDPDVYSVVPSESDHFFRFGYNEKKWIKNGTFQFSLFLNPSTYVVDNVDLGAKTSECADTRVLNLGIKSTLKKDLGDLLSAQVGVEWFSRQNLRVENRVETAGETETTFPLRKGRRNDYSAFVALNWKTSPTFDIDAGIRYTSFSIGAEVEGVKEEKSTGSTSFFIGVIKKLSPSMSLFCNVGRAFRFPSLSETFYSGITGRKYVIGNPLLEPESSFNIDAGMKLKSKNFFMGVYLFTYRVNKLIERYKNEAKIYTYDNIDRGRIYGGEVEIQYSPLNRVDLFGHYFYYRGRSDETDAPLNDIPTPRIFFGGKVYFDNAHRLWIEGDYLYSFKKTNPGPAEIENNSYYLVNLKGGYYFSADLFFYLKISNLFNETYYANPDPDIPEAQGIGVSAGIHFYF